MTDDDQTLQDLTSGIRIAMLATKGPQGLQSRPLTVQRVDGNDVVWFLVGDDTDWLPSVTGEVNLGFVDDQTWVSVAGTGSTTSDAAVLEDLGDPISDSYFNEGVDPVALRIDVGHVDWWTAPGKVRQLAGFAKGIASGSQPDVGERGTID